MADCMSVHKQALHMCTLNEGFVKKAAKNASKKSHIYNHMMKELRLFKSSLIYGMIETDTLHNSLWDTYLTN